MELGGQFTFGCWISTWSASVQAFRGTVALASRGFGTRITIFKFSVVVTEGRDSEKIQGETRSASGYDLHH